MSVGCNDVKLGLQECFQLTSGEVAGLCELSGVRTEEPDSTNMNTFNNVE